MTKVGTYQGLPLAGDIGANLSTIIDISVNAATQQDLDVILFAELFVTGYNINADLLKTLAIFVDGPEINSIKCIAAKYKIAIAFGYAEKVENDKLIYNSCVLIDGNGSVALNYRKTHLFDPYFVFEKVVFTAGDELPVCKLNIAKTNTVITVGILICFDCEFPEPCRVLAMKGAEIVLIATALAEGVLGDQTPTHCLSTRAQENHVFIIYSNLIGLASAPEEPVPSLFCGQSAILSPDGRDLARANKTETGLFTAILDRGVYAENIFRNNYLHMRRPELYGNFI